MVLRAYSTASRASVRAVVHPQFRALVFRSSFFAVPAVVRRTAALVLPLALLAACGDDDSGTTAPTPSPEEREIVVDASTGFAYLAMSGDSLVPVAVTDPSASALWDIGFSGLTTVVNGGNAGPGGASAFCLCPAVNPTLAEVAAFDAATGLARFDAVSAADIPAASAFRTDTLVPAIQAWYDGAQGPGATASSRVFVFVAGQQAALYGKLQVTGISGATATSPGSVTFRWAIQPAPGTGPFGATQTKTVTVGATPVYIDLTTGAETSASGTWHIAFDGWRIRSNGGASGGGNVNITFAQATPFEVMSVTIAQSVPFTAFARDGFAGAFAQPDRQWEYQSSNQTVYPTYDVYLLRRAETVFKLQFTSYYDLQGQSRRLNIRYQRLQ
jgi:hypothetical protein